MNNTFLSYLLDKQLRAIDLKLLSHLAEAIPVRQVTPPNNLGRLHDLYNAMLQDFQASARVPETVTVGLSGARELNQLQRGVSDNGILVPFPLLPERLRRFRCRRRVRHICSLGRWKGSCESRRSEINHFLPGCQIAGCLDADVPN